MTSNSEKPEFAGIRENEYTVRPEVTTEVWLLLYSVYIRFSIKVNKF
jgi:hypothetical protein